ncbi:hypothetical protein [Rhodohalobacter halophilus]|uniref:hypothetical protein n=1 Tax=Rhodohalobacter halophilus TaxID=1812810 RepID=UPI00083F9B3C|nr:hypothetical protein [Rhodohalobacter halophilus]
MGQQQLLLIILVTVIIGIATIVAINTMQASHDAAIEDAIRQDILQAHAMAQGFYTKPAMLGGGDRSFTQLTLRDLSLPEENENAGYSLDEISANGFNIVAESHVGFTVTAAITAGSDEIVWTVSDSEE